MKWNRFMFVSATVGIVAASSYALYEVRRVTLESNGRREYRRVDNAKKVRLVRQLSDKPCVYGVTWGYNRDEIWVDRGCRATFEVEQDGRRDDRWDDRWDDRRGGRRITVESSDDRYRSASIDTRGGVRIVKRLSDAPCIYGRSWGFDRNRIWVDDGCRAVFEVGRGDDRRDWRGPRSNDWDRYGDCPDWLPGRYTGYEDGRQFLLIVDRGGKVTMRRSKGSGWDRDETGYYRDGAVHVGNWNYDIDRDGDRVRLESRSDRNRRIDLRRG
ncbi:MAG: DUF3011 domain-containing protein [Armatimonadetes bacterium]|mgnify:FL=1|nr:DUF3011 domain-containing protein [Armatimonadota bacterium]